MDTWGAGRVVEWGTSCGGHNGRIHTKNLHTRWTIVNALIEMIIYGC